MSPSKRKKKHAFTLVELVVTIAIIFLIIGVGAFAVGGKQSERILEKTKTDIQNTISQAHLLAIREQRPWSLQLYPNKYELLPSSSPPKNERTEEQQLQVTLTNLAQHDIQISLKRLGEKFYHPPEENEQWQFNPSGLCDPISLRLDFPTGYIELDFNPITARLIDERSEFKK